jgi:hypothetical protein
VVELLNALQGGAAGGVVDGAAMSLAHNLRCWLVQTKR